MQDSSSGSTRDTHRLLSDPVRVESYFSIADDESDQAPLVHPHFRGHANPFDIQLKEEFQVYPPLSENELIRASVTPIDMRLRSLLACILCFFPTGMVAVSHALKARREYLNGNVYAAHRKTDLARVWFKFTLIIGILLYSVSFLTLTFVFSLKS